MEARWGKRVASVSMGMAAVAASAGVASAVAGSSARSTGPERVYGADNPFDEATAAVHVVKTGDSATRVTLHVKGVDGASGQTFGAHVHTSPCGAGGADAGPHYQHAGATGSLESREVWLDFTIKASGNGHAEATRPWVLDEALPRSVILHALPTAAETGVAGARLACIDLDGEH